MRNGLHITGHYFPVMFIGKISWVYSHLQFPWFFHNLSVCNQRPMLEKKLSVKSQQIIYLFPSKSLVIWLFKLAGGGEERMALGLKKNALLFSYWARPPYSCLVWYCRIWSLWACSNQTCGVILHLIRQSCNKPWPLPFEGGFIYFCCAQERREYKVIWEVKLPFACPNHVLWGPLVSLTFLLRIV